MLGSNSARATTAVQTTHLVIAKMAVQVKLVYVRACVQFGFLLGVFHGATAVPSVTRCRRRGHRCAGVVANGPNIFQMLLVFLN